MYLALLHLAIVTATASSDAAPENAVFHELTQQGVKMSDGMLFKLPPPYLPEGLDAAGQRDALAKLAASRTTADEPLALSAPVVKVRTLKRAVGEGPAVRAVDLWFVVRGDWNTLTSKPFLESLGKSGEGTSNVVSKSGALTDAEIAKRRLKATVKDDYEERFVYTTFSLFDRVELSATRLATVNRGASAILAAARIDPRFDHDADYPNQWRPLERNERAEIVPGQPRPYGNAGGYAKVTRLAEPADGALIECHLVYEEPYAWFDGANLVAQKAKLLMREKVRTFRRKLSAASERGEKSP